MSSIAKFPVEFHVTESSTPDGNYQTLKMSEPRELIQPSTLEELELPSELDLDREIILYNIKPSWLCSHLTILCKTAPWVAYYDINIKKGIVVYSRVSTFEIGDTIPINTNRNPGTAILIGGPPESGKSVLSYALFQALRDQKYNLNVFLKSANWDGEGKWMFEMIQGAIADQLKERNTRRLHEEENGNELMIKFFHDQANGVKNIKDVMDAVLVDVGGKVQEHKLPVLQQCSHYIIISREREKVIEWQNFFGQSLKPLIVIHSVLEERLEILQTDPFLEVVAGPWITGKTVRVPDVILAHILQAINRF
ncbi:MAG: CRISPR-associated protein Csx3 [Microcoleaceae cyanobacterium]